MMVRWTTFGVKLSRKAVWIAIDHLRQLLNSKDSDSPFDPQNFYGQDQHSWSVNFEKGVPNFMYEFFYVYMFYRI